MNIYLAFILSVGIWVGEFFTFAKYVNTQSIIWETICMIFILMNILLMWMALGIMNKKDFKFKKKMSK